MTDPLEIHLEAETYGVESKQPHTTGTVVIGGLDVTAHVRSVSLRAGVGDITELELTLINIRVNRPEES